MENFEGNTTEDKDSIIKNVSINFKSLQCSLCLHVLVQPITLPCGHK